MTTSNLIKGAVLGAALFATTTAAAAQDRFIAHSGALQMTYRCYHAAAAAGLPEASALLMRGDYDATSRGLSLENRGEFKGWARRQSELDVQSFGSASAAFQQLGCQTIARSPVVAERPGQRIPPPVPE